MNGIDFGEVRHSWWLFENYKHHSYFFSFASSIRDIHFGVITLGKVFHYLH